MLAATVVVLGLSSPRGVLLDPLSLIQDKQAQRTTLRDPSAPPAKPHLETATLALG